MKFINDEAEVFYNYLLKEYGYVHVNASAPLTVEALKEIEEFILKVKEKYQKEKEPKNDLDSYFDNIPW